MTTTGDVAGAPAESASPQARRAARASFIGTTIEWYDFAIYGQAAALVFAPQFFPNFSPLAGTLAALLTFSLGFVARPLGGLVFGHYGDKIGRKNSLIVTLVMMGVACLGIAVLPNYAAIGVAAPILLVVLRLVQGLGVGGEWGGAVLMAVEHAPQRKLALFGSFPQMGNPAGLLLAIVVFLLLNITLGAEQFAAWGWRIAFGIGALLIVVGLLMRRRLEETPAFVDVEQHHDVSRAPLLEMLRSAPGVLALASIASIASPAAGYLLQVYLIGYGRDALKLPVTTMLLLTTFLSVVVFVGIPLAAAWADRVGTKRVFLLGTVGLGIWAVPFFLLIDTRSIPLMLVAYAVISAVLSMILGAQATLLANLFPPRFRYSGASSAYQLGAILGGATAPIVATALFAATGSSTAIAVYLAGLCVVSLLGLLGLREPAPTT